MYIKNAHNQKCEGEKAEKEMRNHLALSKSPTRNVLRLCNDRQIKFACAVILNFFFLI